MDERSDKSKISVIIGHSFSMAGVEDIRGFDEGYVSLDTVSGRITVEGSNLKIESLTKEDGCIFIAGNISGVFIATEEKKRGFFGKIFG